jgi:uncharacterized protein YjiS (DUF1127 family)
MSYASSNTHSASPVRDHQARRDAAPTVLVSAAHAVAGAVVKLATAFVRRRAMARQIAALEALDDRLLADIGVERWQVRHAGRQLRTARGLEPRDILA